MGVWDAAQPFVFGGISGMTATAIIQPIDMVKVRIQLQGEGGAKGASTNPLTVASRIVRQEGFFAMYRGLSAGLLRQATYTTARLGLFNTFIDQLKAQNNGKDLTYVQRAVASLAAGGLGALVGNPADLALIRMQADGTLPAEQRRNYTNVMNALSRIAKEEGILAWWKGATPTVVRAMALNLGMLATHSEAKVRFDKALGKSYTNNFYASAIAGFVASVFSLPFDFVKTRLQKQRPDARGVLPYKGSVDCAMKVFSTEGPLAFYRGFPTYYIRIAPHVMLTLLFSDALNDWANERKKQKK
ncbi:mitochondrial substrate carrier protein [Cladochytrium replicatum]|nr:mitochondrial substrate carrier protein [Cladochytrium replicatum]